jgi:hypothetical protein
VLALFAPAPPGRRLAHRSPLHLRSCAGRPDELIRLIAWLDEQAIESLQQISTQMCEAYLAHRRYVLDEDGVVVGEQSRATRHVAAQAVVDLVADDDRALRVVAEIDAANTGPLRDSFEIGGGLDETQALIEADSPASGHDHLGVTLPHGPCQHLPHQQRAQPAPAQRFVDRQFQERTRARDRPSPTTPAPRRSTTVRCSCSFRWTTSQLSTPSMRFIEWVATMTFTWGSSLCSRMSCMTLCARGAEHPRTLPTSVRDRNPVTEKLVGCN